MRDIPRADAHMHEPRDLWEKWVEPAFQDRVPKVAFMDGLHKVFFVSAMMSVVAIVCSALRGQEDRRHAPSEGSHSPKPEDRPALAAVH